MMACALGEITLGMRLESIRTPECKSAISFRLQLVRRPRWKRSWQNAAGYWGSALAADGALQCAVESGFRLFVFVGRDFSLQPIGFQIEQLFLQRIQQHGCAT